VGNIDGVPDVREDIGEILAGVDFIVDDEQF
jgi:hypothetical protein